MKKHPPFQCPDAACTLDPNAGLTLVEVLIALAIIAVTVGGSITALSQMNAVAQSSRLITGAQAVAQNHLDDALNRDWSRFILVENDLPAPIRPGTHWVVPNMVDRNGNGLPAYYDTTEVDIPRNMSLTPPEPGFSAIPFTYESTEPGEPNVPIYEEDPLDPNALTIFARVSVTATPIEGLNYRLHRIDILVEYEYRGRDYEVPLTTLRSWN